MNDSLIVNIPDSFVKKNLKNPGAGSGEAKLYIGSNKSKKINQFFSSNDTGKIEAEFDKTNLLEYISKVEKYYIPTIETTISSDALKAYYEELKQKISKQGTLTFRVESYEDKYRFYIRSSDTEIWTNIFRALVLPKISNLEIFKEGNKLKFRISLDKDRIFDRKNITEILDENNQIKKKLIELKEEINTKNITDVRLKELKKELDQEKQKQKDLRKNVSTASVLTIDDVLGHIINPITLSKQIDEINADIQNFKNIGGIGLGLSILAFAFFIFGDIPKEWVVYAAHIFTVIFPMIVAIIFFNLSHKKLKEKTQWEKNILYVENMKGLLFAIDTLLDDEDGKKDETKIILKEMSQTFQQQNTVFKESSLTNSNVVLENFLVGLANTFSKQQ